MEGIIKMRWLFIGILFLFLIGCGEEPCTGDNCQLVTGPATNLNFKFFDEKTQDPLVINYKLSGCMGASDISEKESWMTYTLPQNNTCFLDAYNMQYYPTFFTLTFGYVPTAQYRLTMPNKMAESMQLLNEGFDNQEGQLNITLIPENGSYNLNRLCVHWSTNVIYVKSFILPKSTEIADSFYYHDVLMPLDTCYDVNQMLTKNTTFSFEFKTNTEITEEDFILFDFIDNYYYTYDKQVGFNDLIYEVKYNKEAKQ